jgi:NADH-quinone oxidoreductase subunit K
MIQLPSVLALGAILFSIGLYGALTKRNIIIVLVSIELMLNAANINLVAFSRFGGPFMSLGIMPNIGGQVFSLFILTVAAAEVAVGLGVLIALYRNRDTSDVKEMDLMKG